ncbi:MAG TPA: hypothetical protein VGB16_00745 [candidate division Zixibacteria bacterium]
MSFNDEHAIETYKSLISISTEALKAFQWLNGGAVVALLAYIGQRPELAIPARCALTLFVVGLIAASAAFVTSYLTQLALYNEDIREEKYQGTSHVIWLWATLFIAIVSLACFSLGAFAGVRAFAQIP